MNPLLDSKQIYTYQEVKEILLSKLSVLIKSEATKESPEDILRIELPVEAKDVLIWLQSQTITEKVFWADREGNSEVAGLGRADRITGSEVDYTAVFKKITNVLNNSPQNMRYYGGFIFDKGNSADEWKTFNSYYFVLPQFELLKRGQECFFACNVKKDKITKEEINQIQEDLKKIDFAELEEPGLIPSVETREDFPQKEEFIEKLRLLIINLSKGLMEKVVLARKSVFSFTDSLDPLEITKRLKTITPDCYHFCLQPDATTAFLGASPECLYQRQDNVVKSEALAGTRPRGDSPTIDENLMKELLSSQKDLREHQIVVDAIKTKLKDLCLNLDCDEKCSLLQLKGGQHLITHFSGKLNDPIQDSEVLMALHPTPAVSGWPTQQALETIRQEEPFARGYYAGPVGYVSKDAAEFAVAIRSGLVQRNKISLYAGAGIVSDSNPQKEWEEIENKINVFLKIFNQ